MKKTELVKEYIKNEIDAGRLIKGQRLPSCRKVSTEISVNKITVNKAYQELESEHKVYSIPRGGFYLVDSPVDEKASSTIVDFRAVRPDQKLIPFREFSHAMNKAIDLYENSLFGYEASSGLLELRETLKTYFEKDGIYTSSENIVITHGAQQAINLVLQGIFKSKFGKLLVEAPTYGMTLTMADHMGIEVIGIERKESGFDFHEMERILKNENICAFYIVPRHQNPTGYTLTEKDKQHICQLASKYHVQLIEDDYLADLGSKKGYLPLHYYDVEKNTIYIRSFSKTFMPGIRLGAAILPDNFAPRIAELKHISDLNTSKLPQAALDIFIKSGMYEKHIRKVRKSYESKLRKVSDIIQALCPDEISVFIPEHGIFIWIELPEYISAPNFVSALEAVGVLIKNVPDFFPGVWAKNRKSPRPESCLRLCISGVSSEEIGSGMADIFRVYSSLAKPFQTAAPEVQFPSQD